MNHGGWLRDAGGWKKPAYTDPISVDADCDACTGRYLAFVFHNNKHNVQLLLPITVSIDVVPWVSAAHEMCLFYLAPGFNKANGLQTTLHNSTTLVASGASSSSQTAAIAWRLIDWWTGCLVAQGFPFLWVFILSVCCYVGCGLVYARQVQKSTTVGLMAHPHAHQWKEFVSLVVDGTSFVGKKGGAHTKLRGRSRSDGGSGSGRSGYEPIDEEAAATNERSGHKRQKGELDQKKKKKEKKVKEKKGSSKSSAPSSRKQQAAASLSKDSRSQKRDGAAQAPTTGSDQKNEAGDQRMLQEQIELAGNLHQSQAKIKVVGLNESAEM